MGGVVASQDGIYYKSKEGDYVKIAAYDYGNITIGRMTDNNSGIRGRTDTSNHFIGELKAHGYSWLNGIFWGTNTFHDVLVRSGGDASVKNYGAAIFPGICKTLKVKDDVVLQNLPAGSLTYSSSYFTNYVLVGESDNSIPSGKCLGGAYTEINGGTLKVTSPGYFEARADDDGTKIPAGKYAWPLRYKSGTCDIGISTSGGKVRTLFGGAAVGRRITNMGCLRIYGLVASTGKTEDLQSYWMDKGPYGGWYLFDPGYWSLALKFLSRSIVTRWRFFLA